MPPKSALMRKSMNLNSKLTSTENTIFTKQAYFPYVSSPVHLSKPTKTASKKPQFGELSIYFWLGIKSFLCFKRIEVILKEFMNKLRKNTRGEDL